MPPPWIASLRGKIPDDALKGISDLYDKTQQASGSIKTNNSDLSARVSAAEKSQQTQAIQLSQILSILPNFDLTTSGKSTGLNSQGSVIPVPTTGLLYDNATANIIKWYSTGLTLYPPDGSIIVVPDTTVANPIIAVSGLTPSTTYNFYPYYSVDLRRVLFAQVAGGVGTPPAAYTAKSVLAAQAANGDGTIAISPTSSVTAAATSGGGSGGSSGGSGCFRSSMMVQGKGGIVTLHVLKPGDEIFGPEGWTTLKKKIPSMQMEFLRLRFGLGDSLDVAPSHPLKPYRSEVLFPANTWSMVDMIATRSGLPAKLVGIERLDEEDEACWIQCAPSHLLFIGKDAPNLVVSNSVPVK